MPAKENLMPNTNQIAQNPKRKSVMPPRTPRGPERITLKPSESIVRSNFRFAELQGDVTVTTAPLNARDEPRPAPAKEAGDFYPLLPALRITAGSQGASFTLEFHPGLQKRGGPFSTEDMFRKY